MTLTLISAPNYRSPSPPTLGLPVGREQVDGRVLGGRSRAVPILVQLLMLEPAEISTGPERGRHRVELVLLPLQGLETGDQLANGVGPAEGRPGGRGGLSRARERVTFGKGARARDGKTGVPAPVHSKWPGGSAFAGALLLAVRFGADEVLYNRVG